MKSDVILRFVNPEGVEREVGYNKDWRFQKDSGISGFSDFDGDLTFSDNYFRDGGQTENVRLSGKPRTIKIAYVKPEENENERQRFKEYFRYNTSYKIYVTYMGQTRWAVGRLYKCQLSEDTQTDRLLKATMTFQFDNPYWLSVDDFGKNIATVVAGAGFPWLCPVNYGCAIGVFTFSKEVELKNNGDSDAYPIIRIKTTGEVINPKVQVNNGFVRYIGTMNQGDELVMNFSDIPSTIKLNGVNVIGRCDRTSTFDHMNIERGTNIVSYDADNGSDKMEVYVSFNKQYTMI